ncbi:hypothetical protein LCL95_00220 [Bacillus timonensis]|nr:hypothetical protein [Bacillus timonensis]
MKGKWIGAAQVAVVYVGTVVGAGFATGKEIVEFFTQYGIYGLLGILLSGYLFIWIGTKMMMISRQIGAASYKEFNDYLFGKKIGSVVNVLMLVVLLGVTSVMLSGAGAVFQEQLRWHHEIGILFTIGLTIFVMMFGVKGLFSVNIVVVPIMVTFSIILAGKAIAAGGLNIQLDVDKMFEFKWIVSPFTYTAFNLAMAQAVLVPLANEVNDEKVVKWGGILGGAILTAILIANHFTLSAVPNVVQYEIPMAEAMKLFLYSFHWFYILVIYGEIFTSVIGDIFGLQRQLHIMLRVKNTTITVGILAIAYGISQFGYGSLISFLYPLFGYVSLALLFLLIVKKAE